MRRDRIGAWLVTVLALCAACGCAGRGVPPTVEPTEARVVLAPMGTDTVTPPPTQTPPPTLTPVPSSTIDFGPGLAAPEATYLASAPECTVILAAELVTFTLAAEAPEEARSVWAAEARHAFEGEVASSDADRRVHRLRPVDPSSDHEIELSYGSWPLPLETGRRYRFTLWADAAGSTPSGRAMRVDDDGGLLLLIVNVRETEGAGQRVLGGDRAGFAVRQAPSRCRMGPYDDCGYQLRAAPLEIGHGDAWLTLDAGQSGAFAIDPPYVVSVRSSHVRIPVEAAACTDPTDWVQSYRIERQAVTPTPVP